MFHLVHRESAIGRTLDEGEKETFSVFPGYDSERFGTAAEAWARCPKDHRVVRAEMTHRTGHAGAPLFRITAVPESTVSIGGMPS